MNKHIVIIGGGFGGMGAAALLAKQGYRVTLLEKNATLGGRAHTIRKDGFVFDAGPSWYLMPEVFETFFEELGKKTSDYYTLQKLDTQYRIFFGQEDSTDITSNLDANLAYFETLEPGATKKLHAYFHEAERRYKLIMKDFIYHNYHTALDAVQPRFVSFMRELSMLRSFQGYVDKQFTDKRLKQILLYTNVFLGGSPRNTPALFSILNHVDFNQGVFYPMGGMYQVIDALHTIGKEYGATYKTNTPVTRIITKQGAVYGVETASGVIEADIVISNADLPHTELSLLQTEEQSYNKKYWESRTIAPSGFIMYLGLKGRVHNLAHHTLFFDHNWEEHFEEIFKHPRWPQKPSYYVCTPSKTDPSVAPHGDENIFVLVPVASGLEDSDAVREEYSTYILSHLETQIGERFQDRIITKTIRTHRDFTALFNAYKGTALGMSHTLTQSAWWRPSVRSRAIQHLYYVGQYTQPGIGMPMCLISAQLVAGEIAKRT